MAKFLVIHGPNLNLLGIREPDIYGHATLEQINLNLNTIASKHNHELCTFQSNAEHSMIERIHSAVGEAIDAIIINPAAFGHTSIALRDALLAAAIPFYEVHISNIFSRESYRHHSYLADIAVGIVSGLGIYGYQAALQSAFDSLISH